jgi:LmbE family N-acetylglucosaminyl deacetylase
MRKYKTLIISPHMDDAFLDLGGYILTKNRDEIIEIIDIFSLDPWTIGEFGSKAKRVNIRKNEESSNSYKTNVKIHFWDYPAAWKERGYLCWSDKVDLEKDSELILELKKRIENKILMGQFEKIFYPIGIGGHVDHQIIHEIGIQLSAEHDKIQSYYYEDLPYALNTDFWERSYGFFSSKYLSYKSINFSTFLEEKMALLSAYKSQLTLEEVEAVMEYSLYPYKFIPKRLEGLVKDKITDGIERIWFLSKV